MPETTYLGAITETLAEALREDQRVLVLGEDVIASERNVILEERNQRIDNDPSARFSRVLVQPLVASARFAFAMPAIICCIISAPRQ